MIKSVQILGDGLNIFCFHLEKIKNKSENKFI